MECTYPAVRSWTCRQTVAMTKGSPYMSWCKIDSTFFFNVQKSITFFRLCLYLEPFLLNSSTHACAGTPWGSIMSTRGLTGTTTSPSTLTMSTQVSLSGICKPLKNSAMVQSRRNFPGVKKFHGHGVIQVRIASSTMATWLDHALAGDCCPRRPTRSLELKGPIRDPQYQYLSFYGACRALCSSPIWPQFEYHIKDMGHSSSKEIA